MPPRRPPSPSPAPPARPGQEADDPADEPGFVYVLGTCTPRGVRTYVGWTLDPERRLAQHNAGTGAKSTRGKRWTLLYLERHATRIAAMRREWHLKRDRRFRAALAGRHLAEEPAEL